MNWQNILNNSRIRVSDRNIDTDRRNDFESDYGRIIFSPAIRRMHDKTQVVPLPIDDNVHTRLTHSLEVQSLANSMGVRICLDERFKNRINLSLEDSMRIIPSILSSISLCHDIGNPPFGHYGEKIISDFFYDYFSKNKGICMSEVEKLDFTKFDGNAQGFRILCKQQILQDLYGLNLTIGVLSAYLKYPYMSNELTGQSFGKKIGIFQSEKETLLRIRESSGLDKTRNPLTFLMEAADNICYNVVDLEDGFNSGYYCFDELYKHFKLSNDEKIREIVDKFDLEIVKIDNIGINQDQTKMVRFRIFLIGELVNDAIENFLNNLDDIEQGKYQEELLHKENNSLIKLLKQLNRDMVISKRDVHTVELTGESVLRGLLNHFVDDFINYKDEKSPSADRANRLYSQISSGLKVLIRLETKKQNLYEFPDYYKLRLIVDYITGMTDSFALSLYQKLQGIKL